MPHGQWEPRRKPSRGRIAYTGYRRTVVPSGCTRVLVPLCALDFLMSLDFTLQGPRWLRSSLWPFVLPVCLGFTPTDNAARKQVSFELCSYLVCTYLVIWYFKQWFTFRSQVLYFDLLFAYLLQIPVSCFSPSKTKVLFRWVLYYAPFVSTFTAQCIIVMETHFWHP